MPTVTRDQVRLHYTDAGDGPPLLFHTGGAGDGRMWEIAGYTQILTPARQIVMDHRGHGQSDCPEDLASHRVEEYVDDLIAVLDAAEVEQAVIVGYSAGASVAYRAAAWYPERCSALVAIGGVPLSDQPRPSSNQLIDHVREHGVRATIEALAADESEPCPPLLLENLSSTKAEMFALLMEAWLDAPSVWDCFPLITATALIICGEHEDEQGETAQAAATMRNGHALVLPGLGHLQAFWHRELTPPLIRDFLQERWLIGVLDAAEVEQAIMYTPRV